MKKEKDEEEKRKEEKDEENLRDEEEKDEENFRCAIEHVWRSLMVENDLTSKVNRVRIVTRSRLEAWSKKGIQRSIWILRNKRAATKTRWSYLGWMRRCQNGRICRLRGAV